MTKKQIALSLREYPDALTVEEVAQILRVCTKTVYKIIRGKELPAVKIGREYRISKSAVVDHLRALDKAASNPKYVLSDNSFSWGSLSQQSCDIVQGVNNYGSTQNELPRQRTG